VAPPPAAELPPAAALPPAASQPLPPAPAALSLGEADLATSYLTLEQLIAERGMPMGSLGELVDGGTVGARAATAPPAPGRRTTGGRSVGAMAKPEAEAVVPIESLAPDEAGVVPIETLLYRGASAVRRLHELKAEIEVATRQQDARLPEMIREVFDLVELGLGAGH
jgi:hypothetical protein